MASRLAETSGRIDFVSCGLASHLRLLSTPPLGDAVTFSFQAGERMPGEGSHLHTCALAGALARDFNPGAALGLTPPGIEIPGYCASSLRDSRGESYL